MTKHAIHNITTHRMSYEAFCEHVSKCADTVTHGLINWRNVSFNWAERHQSGEVLAATIDALVAAGFEQIEHRRNEMRHEHETLERFDRAIANRKAFSE